jgi:hypothetical protein
VPRLRLARGGPPNSGSIICSYIAQLDAGRMVSGTSLPGQGRDHYLDVFAYCLRRDERAAAVPILFAAISEGDDTPLRRADTRGVQNEDRADCFFGTDRRRAAVPHRFCESLIIVVVAPLLRGYSLIPGPRP